MPGKIQIELWAVKRSRIQRVLRIQPLVPLPHLKCPLPALELTHELAAEVTLSLASDMALDLVLTPLGLAVLCH